VRAFDLDRPAEDVDAVGEADVARPTGRVRSAAPSSLIATSRMPERASTVTFTADARACFRESCNARTRGGTGDGGCHIVPMLGSRSVE
jgi:hypothetical protein